MDEETSSLGDLRINIGARSGQSRRRVLYKVPVQLRENKKHIYDPVVLPLGPYHHGREPHFHVAEQLKDELRDIICRSNDKGTLLRKISERMDEIRHFYGGADGFGDEKLAEMMLRDACFLLCYLEEGENDDLIDRRLGMSGTLFMYRDVYMLENQIPLWLLNLIYEGQTGQSLLCKYLSYIIFGDERMRQLPWEYGEEEEPLHLLEAIHRTVFSLVETEESSNILRVIKKYIQPTKRRSKTQWQMWNRPFRSVTDLKAKGIHFKRSSHCLTDIKFFSLSFYAQLHLPFYYVTYNSLVFLSNAIAFEMSPETPKTVCIVTSYVNFMKTLIDKASDVKELREKEILYSDMANDEELVRMFKSIDTYGFANDELLYDVKMRMEDHCNSKAKTWMADLINTKFRSPWTVIALTAAAFLLCLTFLQTYYTINPRK